MPNVLWHRHEEVERTPLAGFHFYRAVVTAGSYDVTARSESNRKPAIAVALALRDGSVVRGVQYLDTRTVHVKRHSGRSAPAS